MDKELREQLRDDIYEGLEKIEAKSVDIWIFPKRIIADKLLKILIEKGWVNKKKRMEAK